MAVFELAIKLTQCFNLNERLQKKPVVQEYNTCRHLVLFENENDYLVIIISNLIIINLVIVYIGL